MTKKKEIYGIITDIKKFATHDGPGIRTTVFCKGCPLNCEWCANPETISVESGLYYLKSRCCECKICKDICAAGAIEFRNEIIINREKCNKCFKCVEICSNKALVKVGYKIGVSKLIKILIEDKPFYKNGGGVTFSGGEPLLQREFLETALIYCKRNNLNVVLDTSGYAQSDYIKSIVKYIDMTLLDIKHMDEGKHMEATGVSNKIILKNAEIFADKTTTRISIPLIPGFNDDELNLKRTADFANNLNIKNVDINLFHKYGEQKYKYLGKLSPYNEYKNEFSNNDIKKIKSIFNKQLIQITLGRNF